MKRSPETNFTTMAPGETARKALLGFQNKHRERWQGGKDVNPERKAVKEVQVIAQAFTSLMTAREIISSKVFNRQDIPELAFAFSSAARNFNRGVRTIKQGGNRDRAISYFTDASTEAQRALVSFKLKGRTRKERPVGPVRKDKLYKPANNDKTLRRILFALGFASGAIALAGCSPSETISPVQEQNVAENPTPAEQPEPGEVETETLPEEIEEVTEGDFNVVEGISPTPTVSVDIEGLPSDLNEFEAQEITDIAQNWADVIQEGIDKNQSLREAMGNQIVVINPANFSIDEKTGSTVYLTQEGGPLGDAEMAIGKNNELVVGTFGGATAITGITVSKETHYWDHWKKNSTGEQILLIRDKTTGEIVLATENYQWKKASEVSFIGEIDRSFIETGKNAIDASREDIEVAWEEMSYEQKLKYIETNPFAEEFGEGVSIGVKSPNGEKVTFNDGSKQIELSALWGYDGNAVPFGEVLSIENQEDLKHLQSDILGNNESKIEALNRDSVYRKNIKFIQFYPDNDTWRMDENINGLHFVDGFFVIKYEDKLLVIKGTTNPYRALFIYGEEKTGSMITDLISENKSLSPSLIGIVSENVVNPASSGANRPLYTKDVSEEYFNEKLLGSEELENIEKFIDSIFQGKAPVFSEAISLDTIDKKN